MACMDSCNPRWIANANLRHRPSRTTYRRRRFIYQEQPQRR